MAWVRLDDQIPRHDKMLRAGPAASWLWVCAIAHAQSQLTDGFISNAALLTFGIPHAKKLATVLLSVRLFDKAEGGYRVHDYHDFNASAEEVRAEMEWDRRRKSLYSDHELIEFIKRRDGNACRYCGIPVNWKDRRGPRGGQFDHVIARGQNTAENIVVACRGCNTRKGNRTLEECGMALRPVDQSQVETKSDSVHIPSHPIPSNPIQEKTTTPRPTTFGRITLHRWQLDALITALGPHADGFALDEWVHGLSGLADQRGLVLDRRTLWPWVQAELRAECERRGLSVASGEAQSFGKQTSRLLQAVANLPG